MKTLLMLVLVAGCAKADPPSSTPTPAASASVMAPGSTAASRDTKTTGADLDTTHRDAGLVPPITVPPEMGTVQTR